jgi:hypothetical protein
MAQYKLHKVLSLPGTPEANSIYFVKEGTTEFKIYVTDNSGTALSLNTPEATSGRTMKTVSNSTQYTVVAADYTDFILYFDADTAGANINVIINENVAPDLEGELVIYSGANHVLNFVAGTNVTLKTTAGNLLQSSNDGDSIAILGVKPMGGVNTQGVYGTLVFDADDNEVEFYADFGSFPATGSTETVYIARDTNTLYSWSGSAYEEISANGGGSADKNVLHNQGTPSASWVINHNLNKYPAVQVFDSAGTMVIGDVVYDDLNNVTITFSAAFSGKATLN